MLHRYVTRKSAGWLAVGIFLGMMVGCQTPGAGNLSPVTDASGGRGAVVSFITPANSFDLKDDATAAVKYRVISDSEATIRLLLDADSTPDNGNEMDLGPARTVAGGSVSDEAELIAGRYPYGNYWIRANVRNAAGSSSFLAPGTVRIVSATGETGSDPVAEGIAGLQVVLDTGAPAAVDGRVPFVLFWHVLDVRDNLAPRAIMPIVLTEPIELHRLQAYGYGQSSPSYRRVDIYSGTDENTPGTLIHRSDATVSSKFSGAWSTMALSEPVILQPGKYGVSYHSEYEFMEWTAANAPNGSDYLWVSYNHESPFRRVGVGDFGFAPNMAIRLLGKPLSKTSAARTAAADVPAPKLDLKYRVGDEAAMQPHPEDSEEALPLHTSWREVLPAAK